MYSKIEFFQNTFVINLKNRTDRYLHIKKQCEKVNIIPIFVEAEQPKQNPYTRPENYANYLSQMQAVRYARDNKLKNIVILEDDCIFSKDFTLQIDKCLVELKEDWNILYLGAYIQCLPEKVSENISKVANTFCTHAYCINSNFYNIILNQRPEKLDILYTRLQKQYNFYCCTPIIAWQIPGYSDIMKQPEDYTKYLPDYKERF
jgi:GR25 family glycosyltransferase involved in LPS biosynthesis